MLLHFDAGIHFNHILSLLVHILLLSNLSGKVLAQLFERITVLENSRLNTVILDIRAALVRHGEGQLPVNATAYASQQETFWPFVLDDFIIKLGRPLDREAVCRRQRQSTRRVDSNIPSLSSSVQSAPTHPSTGSTGCLVGACCQLLHVNIVPDPTALPKAFFVQVVVQDVNDNPPLFAPLHSPYTVVREDVSPTERIWLPRAHDPDSPPYSVIEYRTESWVHGNQSHFRLGVAEDNMDSDQRLSEQNTAGFTVDRYNIAPSDDTRAGNTIGRPYLVPTQRLDRELCDVYAFTLIAIDGGDRHLPGVDAQQRALTGSVNIVIKIEDVNDNAPTFDRSVYKAQVIENVVTQNVLEFDVTDQDIGDNGRVTVTIQDTSGHAHRLFRVGLQPIKTSSVHRLSSTATPTGSRYRGFLQLTNHIDAERVPPMIRFNLVTSDYGQPSLSSRAEVNIHVVNVNDNAPTIAFFSHGKRLTDARIAVAEVVTPLRSLIVLVHVTDADTPVEQVQCQLTHAADMFSLEEASSGNSVVQPYHTGLAYEPPAFEPRGMMASYRQFAIRTRRDLDRETKNYYLITVECTDSEGSSSLSRNASLHLTVTDVNDHSPRFDKTVYRGHVAENSASAEVLLSSPLHVTDADTGANARLTFQLQDLANQSSEHGASGTSINNTSSNSRFFRVDPRSGRIWTTVLLDCETRSEYDLLLIVRDSGSEQQRSSSATIHVTVDDMNDNVPEFTLAHYLFEVDENAPGGTEIGRVEATDRDMTEINRKLRYTIRGRVEDVHLISVDRGTGILRTRRPIDRESQSSISLLITAENEMPIRMVSTGHPGMIGSGSDSSNPHSAKASLVVSILNVNDNRPEFTLIEPHRSHVTFSWEQLSNLPQVESRENERKKELSDRMDEKVDKAGKDEAGVETATKKPFGVTASPVCERLPHRVIDKDTEPNSVLSCCILQLLDDFEGVFALMPEAPNFLCILRRPPSPKSYKLTLIAKDGVANDSLSSQIHFTVVIRSEPDLRALENPRAMDKHSRTLDGSDSTLISNDRSGQVFNSGPAWQRGSQQDTHQNGVERVNRGRSRSPTSSHQGIGDSANPQTQQTIIIIVMASVAGILCVLLILAIVLTKRCIFDAKVEFDKENRDRSLEETMGPKRSNSALSTPSKTQSCPMASISTQQRTLGHNDYYAKEMVYHHPLSRNDHTYELTARTSCSQPGFLSPTIGRSAIRVGPNSTFVLTEPTLLPQSMRLHERLLENPSVLTSVLQSSSYAGSPDSKLNKISGSPVISATPSTTTGLSEPWSQSPQTMHSLSHLVRATGQQSIPNNMLDTRQTLDHANDYQIIDPTMLRSKSKMACSPLGDPLHTGMADTRCSMDESGQTTLLRKNSLSELDMVDPRQRSPYSRGYVANQSYASVNQQRKKLQRTNSERNGYLQGSFV